MSRDSQVQNSTIIKKFSLWEVVQRWSYIYIHFYVPFSLGSWLFFCVVSLESLILYDSSFAHPFATFLKQNYQKTKSFFFSFFFSKNKLHCRMLILRPNVARAVRTSCPSSEACPYLVRRFVRDFRIISMAKQWPTKFTNTWSWLASTARNGAHFPVEIFGKFCNLAIWCGLLAWPH